jgi:hypothetical protein
MHLLHLLNALLAEPLRILSDSGIPLRTHNRVLSLCTPLYTRSMPSWQSSHRILSDSVCNCVSATQPCLLRCSVTSKVLLLYKLLTSVLCLSTSLSDSSRVQKCILLCTGIQSLNTLSRPHGMKPQRPLKPEINTLPAIT